MINLAPPKNNDMERLVLEALLSQIEVPPVCLPKLKESSFTGRNRATYKAIRTDWQANGDVDRIRVEEILGENLPPDGEWIPPEKAEEYCDRLAGLAAKRRWLRGIQQEAENIDRRTPKELFANTENIIHDNLQAITIPGLTPSEIEARDQARPRGQQLLTGDEFMDRTFFGASGSRRGQITVPFADTGHGKTFWAVWLASRYLEQGYKGVFCIFESTDTKIKDRIKANLTVPDPLDNIIIADVGQGMMNLEDSASLIKYYNALMGVDFFIVDHTRIVPVDGLPDWKENEKVTTCINRYMRLAQQTQSHGVCLSQVNRATTNNSRGWGKDPQLNNLYGSSAIEQAAEVAVSLFRPKKIEELRDYYPSGKLRAVKGPNYDTDGKTYDPNTVFIRHKKVREGEEYVPYVRFIHGEGGLQRVKEETPF